MNGLITITLNEENGFYKYNLLPSYHPMFDFNFELNVQSNSKFFPFDTNKIKNELKEVSLSYEDIDDLTENKNLIEKYLSDGCDFFEDSSYIEFFGKYDEINEYLDNNPELKKKNIIVSKVFGLNRNELEELKSNLYDVPNLYVWVKGNEKPISIDKYEKTVEKIEEMAHIIKKYNYSPFEKLLYAYDLSRDREYSLEEDGEDYTLSRDLSSVLLGDKIVCSGFSHVFEALLDQLEIKVRCYDLDKIGEDIGHSRNIIYLKDEKYGIDGVYYCDVTWDNRKTIDNHFLNVYRFFAKTKSEIESYSDKYFDPNLPNFDYDLLDKLKISYDGINFLTIPKDVLKQINYVSTFVDGKSLITFKNVDVEEIEDCMDRYMELFERPITSEQFMKALVVVRKNEYYEDPLKYPYDIDSFYSSLVLSDFSLEDCKANQMQYFFTGGRRNIQNKNYCVHYMSKFICDHTLDLDIERTKIARTLKKVLNSKK